MVGETKEHNAAFQAECDKLDEEWENRTAPEEEEIPEDTPLRKFADLDLAQRYVLLLIAV